MVHVLYMPTSSGPKKHQHQHGHGAAEPPVQRKLLRWIALSLLFMAIVVLLPSAMSTRRAQQLVTQASAYMPSAVASVAAVLPPVVPPNLTWGYWAAPRPSATPRGTLEMFPQAAACMLNPWIQNYADKHASIMSGEAPKRHLIFIPTWTGTADRITAMVTQFYLAVLSGRAFTMYVPPDRAPGFEAACDFPFFNWTHPAPLADGLLTPFYRDKERRPAKRLNETNPYPPPFSREYAWHDMINPYPRDLPFLQVANMSGFPADHPGVPHVISSSNRGATWHLTQNPYHRDEFWRMGLSPTTAFMCGFFSMCAPNAAVQQLYYEPFWKPLQQPGVLKIGIQVRFGDDIAFLGTNPVGIDGLIRLASPFFACASEIERAFATPGQQVIWYLLSDSATFRQAAKQMFGSKLLTDSTLEAVHIDCQMNKDPALCSGETMNDALRQSVGSITAFSLTDYHVITKRSGFGRMGAWLSGRWDNIYELAPGDEDAVAACPRAPTKPAESASRFSHV